MLAVMEASVKRLKDLFVTTGEPETLPAQRVVFQADQQDQRITSSVMQVAKRE